MGVATRITATPETRSGIFKPSLKTSVLPGATHNLPMAASDHWTEILRCPFCALTGVASLSQGTTGGLAIVVDELSSGFKAVSSEYGDTFFCSACNRAAATTLR
jgi:hypothetical protein